PWWATLSASTRGRSSGPVTSLSASAVSRSRNGPSRASATTARSFGSPLGRQAGGGGGGQSTVRRRVPRRRASPANGATTRAWAARRAGRRHARAHRDGRGRERRARAPTPGTRVHHRQRPRPRQHGRQRLVPLVAPPAQQRGASGGEADVGRRNRRGRGEAHG